MQSVYKSPDDSAPTPVIELGYNDLNLLFTRTADNLNVRAKVLREACISGKIRKNEARAFLDRKIARDCDRLIVECGRLATRVLSWKSISHAALIGEKDYVNKQWLRVGPLINKILEVGKQ